MKSWQVVYRDGSKSNLLTRRQAELYMHVYYLSAKYAEKVKGPFKYVKICPQVERTYRDRKIGGFGDRKD